MYTVSPAVIPPVYLPHGFNYFLDCFPGSCGSLTFDRPRGVNTPRPTGCLLAARRKNQKNRKKEGRKERKEGRKGVRKRERKGRRKEGRRREGRKEIVHSLWRRQNAPGDLIREFLYQGSCRAHST